MGEKLVIGPINKGLRKDRLPFVIDNDSFPQLYNAYQWRGRIKRKRGTESLTRFRRFLVSQSLGSTTGGGTFSGNIFSILSISGTIVPSSITLTIGAATFTDNGNGSLSDGGVGSGTINYATGAITLLGAPNSTAISATFQYYPTLPVMGLRTFENSSTSYLNYLGFDTDYPYNITPFTPYTSWSVNYFKNPSDATINTIVYNAKTTWSSFVFNGQNYQQFWTVNYEGSLWETNGITNPFSTTNIGMQFKACATVVYVNATQLTITITEASRSLVEGDWVFINEVTGAGGTADASTINFQTGFVTASANAAGTTTLTVRFPYAAIAAPGGGSYSAGILQYLTNVSDSTKDCLKWYDGDPTTGVSHQPGTALGWVNFCPPLSQSSFSIASLPSAQYYLVGAKIIFPFKDRILFFGPVVQTSTGSPIYLKNVIIYSQNGTPYYTASFSGSVTSTTTVFNQLLVPSNQTATPNAYFCDSTGFGGFIQAGIDESINTVSSNEDVLILGFDSHQVRLVSTGNDIIPFNFFVINSELGSNSTFSAINLDKGVLTVGERGLIQTAQISSQRFDLDIPDQVFEVNLDSNGAERICSQRDFINEWIYFSYRADQNSSSTYVYPTQTLFYNYRDHSWAVMIESFTSYGTFRRQDGETWDQITINWEEWNTNWEDSGNNVKQPEVMAGNSQGFVVFRTTNTQEAPTLSIQGLSGSTVSCNDHCLNPGDYILITGCLGTIGNGINQRIYQVSTTSLNSFTVTSPLPSGTYIGGGLITRFYIPFIQSKQFPTAWDMGRKTRIGAQRYLMTTTPNAQVTLYLYLSEDSSTPYNRGPILPSSSPNNSLVYSTVLYTCLESLNLGLTPANTNLQMISQFNSDNTNATTTQDQIWHRINTSLIGDTVQFAITLSDEQMGYTTVASYVITGATKASSCVLTCTSTGALSDNVSINDLVYISGVGGMTELNGNMYLVTAVSSTTMTIAVDSTSFGTYTSGGTAEIKEPVNQDAEIEFHGAVLDLYPSQVLA